MVWKLSVAVLMLWKCGWPVGGVEKAKPKDIVQSMGGLLTMDQVKSHLQKYRRTAGRGGADSGFPAAAALSGSRRKRAGAPGAAARSPPALRPAQPAAGGDTAPGRALSMYADTTPVLLCTLAAAGEAGLLASPRPATKRRSACAETAPSAWWAKGALRQLPTLPQGPSALSTSPLVQALGPEQVAVPFPALELSSSSWGHVQLQSAPVPLQQPWPQLPPPPPQQQQPGSVAAALLRAEPSPRPPLKLAPAAAPPAARPPAYNLPAAAPLHAHNLPETVAEQTLQMAKKQQQALLGQLATSVQVRLFPTVALPLACLWPFLAPSPHVNASEC